MGNLNKELEKCKHPNARKTLALAKKAKKVNNRNKNKLANVIKTSIIGEKLGWFSQHIEDKVDPLTPEEFKNLIDKYFHRFDEEIEQINLKQSISKNRRNQHIARQNAIKFTLEREQNEYNSGGIDLINLCDSEKFKILKEWDGSAINIQHMKLDLISKKFFEKLTKNQIEKPKIVITPPDEEGKSMEF
ncbi:translation machinery-associated protein 16 homolog [Condylostylus longicornis]|uniref:translation machinery-associated protein 16 homolog n=1 Tax=Condylostylus longicornis TaxID=2530218 RepID=UPI00244DD65D|nr:translation machinery-associated protein 16 homolog [Condylostylus longicornis]